MTRATALKIIAAILDEHITRRLAYGANMYAQGYRDEWAERAHAERERIREAWAIVKEPERLLF